MKTLKNTAVVIMAGGIGSRFWPVSRSSYLKQFIDILGVGKSLLQLTYIRFSQLVAPEFIYVVANQAYRELVIQQLPDLPPENIISEPMARNTAPCIAYASYKIAKLHPKFNCVVAPSDHLILNDVDFLNTIERAVEFTSQQPTLVTLGVKPNRPDTGYGYIQYIPTTSNNQVFKVKTFTEKPTLELAKTFLESGEFLWNAGIFIWNLQSIKKSIEAHLPDIHALFKEAYSALGTEKETEAIQKVYSRCTNISIDYGVMEKADNVYVIPSDFGWSDLGTWKSLYENSPKDADENVGIGKNIILEESEHCMVYAPDHKLVVIKGIQNAIVVDSGDVLLVCDKDKEQEVKQIVTDIKLKFDEKYT